MPDKPHVLLVEDDRSIRETTEMGLRGPGFGVAAVADGVSALQRFRLDPPDVVVLDLMIPLLDGFAVCRQMRAESAVPVVMLTARSAADDVVRGLEAGADDYVRKPFEIPELVARLHAVMRRARGADHVGQIRLGPLAIDAGAHSVERDGSAVELTPTEFRLLLELASRPGQVFTRELLLERVWGYDYLGDSRLVDVCVQRLRAKIEHDPGNPELIVTVRGAGYKAARG